MQFVIHLYYRFVTDLPSQKMSTILFVIGLVILKKNVYFV